VYVYRLPILFLTGLLLLVVSAAPADARPPNVLLIITDDQGWGDLGFHGNDKIKTPHLDALARQSVVLKNFYVSPVCTPTRASLMTGRYNYRTGAIDTYRGRAMMHPDEVTLAEMFRDAGYRTGIFGKWHLGDNYPLRAQDQGFQESLTLWGGGLVQSADPPGGNSYQDPWLSKNGKDERHKGYCSDIYTDAALEHISRPHADPFFVYLAFNCPHTPLQIRDEDYRPYQQMGLDETTAKIYGMVTNIDHNVGRLLRKLDELQLAADTIVVFMTDNGPQQARYNGRWRGLKGSVYEGGIHVPFFIRWPARLKAGYEVEQAAAHIDVAPTLLAACAVKIPAAVKFDGRNLLPLLEGKSTEWPERSLFFQWHRGDVPELFRACAVRGSRFKLVQAVGASENRPAAFKCELFDLANDPGEQRDLADENPEIVARLKAEYEVWFRDVSATRGYEPPAIHLGTEDENPVRLSRQDLRGTGPDEPGYWRVKLNPGRYEAKLIFAKGPIESASLRVEGQNDVTLQSVDALRGVQASEATLDFRATQPVDGKLRAWITRDGRDSGVQYVVLTRK
jgi:arylsulfatase A-like enzyme